MMSPLTIGDRMRLARSLSRIENRDGDWRCVLRGGLRDLNTCRTVGVTGPPGAGKSTLINAMATYWSDGGDSVAILAIDPSSPFSGGAVLGDRIRMSHAEANDTIFIRSVSARGHVGGTSRALVDLSCFLSSNGFDKIIIETIGVGQNEVEIAFATDCTLVVNVPGLGDSVQAAKAGIMEVGDIYCVNKSDLPGAGSVSNDILGLLRHVFPGEPGVNDNLPDRLPGIAVNDVTARRFGLRGAASYWHPPVVPTSAANSGSIGVLCGAVERFWLWLDESGVAAFRDGQRAERLLRRLLQHRLLDDALAKLAETKSRSLATWASLINTGNADAYDAVDTITEQLRDPPREA